MKATTCPVRVEGMGRSYRPRPSRCSIIRPVGVGCKSNLAWSFLRRGRQCADDSAAEHSRASRAREGKKYRPGPAAAQDGAICWPTPAVSVAARRPTGRCHRCRSRPGVAGPRARERQGVVDRSGNPPRVRAGATEDGHAVEAFHLVEVGSHGDVVKLRDGVGSGRIRRCGRRRSETPDRWPRRSRRLRRPCRNRRHSSSRHTPPVWTRSAASDRHTGPRAWRQTRRHRPNLVQIGHVIGPAGRRAAVVEGKTVGEGIGRRRVHHRIAVGPGAVHIVAPGVVEVRRIAAARRRRGGGRKSNDRHVQKRGESALDPTIGGSLRGCARPGKGLAGRQPRRDKALTEGYTTRTTLVLAFSTAQRRRFSPPFTSRQYYCLRTGNRSGQSFTGPLAWISLDIRAHTYKPPPSPRE